MISFDLAQLEAWIAIFLFPFVRVLALLASAPVLGHRNIPLRVKVCLAFAVSATLGPTLGIGGTQTIASSQGLIILIQQILIGVSMGFTVRLIFGAIELAGEIMGSQLGLNFAGFFDPQSAQLGTPFGAWLGVIATLIFLAMNGHLLMIFALSESFRILPIGTESFIAADWQKYALLGTELFRIALMLALPVIVAMLLCNLALGVLSRIAPQVNLLSLSFSVTIIVGLAVLMLSLPVMGAFIQQTLQRGVELMLMR
jgi:flagellar biosynthesis protein FliR